jgi:hypothetical protein
MRARAVELVYEGGVREFVKYLDRSKTPMIETRSMWRVRRTASVEVAMWWNDSYHEMVLPFTNNIPQRDGGTHMAGFPRRADPDDEPLRQLHGHREAREGELHRRRRARGADLRPVGQGAGPEVQRPRPRTSLSPPRCAPPSKA